MKNIIIIGGNRGVGFEVVKSCLKMGYRVAFTGKECDNLLIKEQNDKIIFSSFDLKDTKKSIQFVEDVIDKWKKIDAVVFYAGITPISSLTDCNEELFDDIFSINLKSTFFITQVAIKNMIANGGGSFVFFGTSHMEFGQIDRAAYAISKGGLKTLSEHLARQYSRFKIRSNIIVMGWTPTDGEIALRSSQGVSKEELIAEASHNIPMGRMLSINDPIPTVLHFLSDDSNMITGSVVRITGGEYI